MSWKWLAAPGRSCQSSSRSVRSPLCGLAGGMFSWCSFFSPPQQSPPFLKRPDVKEVQPFGPISSAQFHKSGRLSPHSLGRSVVLPFPSLCNVLLSWKQGDNRRHWMILPTPPPDATFTPLYGNDALLVVQAVRRFPPPSAMTPSPTCKA